ncbi:hypothetical protein DOJK_00494 [Patescibacteria group bacterium]|nr:hypothetical protein DOJK_00494 [Patescibacteria group bacterium]
MRDTYNPVLEIADNYRINDKNRCSAMFGKERIMQGHINHIRELLSQIEAESIAKEADSFERN